jgi:hypothetical protein
MGAYQVIATGKAGVGGRVVELEQATLDKIRWELNRAGRMSFSLPTSDVKGKEFDIVKNEVQVWRDGTLFWWGVPWRRASQGEKTTYECEGLFSYFFRRFVLATQTFSQVDQHTIAWNLLNYAQGQTNGALGITAAAFAGSGILRDRTYLKDEHAKIGEAITAFTELQNGFDFEIEIFGDGRREWTPYYPSKGVLQSPLIMEWGRNIVSYRWLFDAVRMANHVVVTGAGEGDTKIESSASDSPAQTTNLLLSDVRSESDVKDTSTLLQKAQEEVARRKNPISIGTITVSDTPVPLIGVVKTGDRVPVRIDDGIAQVSANYRIVAIELDPKEETLALDLNVE